jgi:hypothetical protein
MTISRSRRERTLAAWRSTRRRRTFTYNRSVRQRRAELTRVLADPNRQVRVVDSALLDHMERREVGPLEDGKVRFTFWSFALDGYTTIQVGTPANPNTPVQKVFKDAIINHEKEAGRKLTRKQLKELEDSEIMASVPSDAPGIEEFKEEHPDYGVLIASDE